jgi:hypothetical protein
MGFGIVSAFSGNFLNGLAGTDQAFPAKARAVRSSRPDQEQWVALPSGR